MIQLWVIRPLCRQDLFYDVTVYEVRTKRDQRRSLCSHLIVVVHHHPHF